MVDCFNRNPDLVKLKKVEPCGVHYHFYFNVYQGLDEENLIAAAKEQGWINVNKNPIVAAVFLFISYEHDPLPLETDEDEQLRMYQPKKRKSKWYWFALCAALSFIIYDIICFRWYAWWLIFQSILIVSLINLLRLERFFSQRTVQSLNENQQRLMAIGFRILRFSLIPIYLLFVILTLNNTIPFASPYLQ